jgi:hypothetical protein
MKSLMGEILGAVLLLVLGFAVLDWAWHLLAPLLPVIGLAAIVLGVLRLFVALRRL